MSNVTFTAVVMLPGRAPEPREFTAASASYWNWEHVYGTFLGGPADPLPWGDLCIVYVREGHEAQHLAFNAMLGGTRVFGPMLVVAESSPPPPSDRGFTREEATEVVRVLGQLRREACLFPPFVEPPFPAWTPTDEQVRRALKALERRRYGTEYMTGRIRRLPLALVAQETRVEDWLKSLKRQAWDELMAHLKA